MQLPFDFAPKRRQSHHRKREDSGLQPQNVKSGVWRIWENIAIHKRPLANTRDIKRARAPTHRSHPSNNGNGTKSPCLGYRANKAITEIAIPPHPSNFPPISTHPLMGDRSVQRAIKKRCKASEGVWPTSKEQNHSYTDVYRAPKTTFPTLLRWSDVKSLHAAKIHQTAGSQTVSASCPLLASTK